MKRAKESLSDRLWRSVTGRTPDVLRRPAVDKLAEIRKANPGMSNRELARHVGVSPETLRRYGKGTQAPSKRTASRIDRTMRKDLTEKRAPRIERGPLTLQAKVKIGGEPPRTRKFNLDKVLTPEEKRQVVNAAASGRDDVAQATLQRAIGRYIGVSRDYPVQVQNVTSLKAG